MAVEIQSKKGIVSKAPYELYMLFVDMRNFVNFLPEEKKQGVTADYDSIHAEVQGFNIGVKVVERVPYSRIVFQDDGAPFTFEVAMFSIRLRPIPSRQSSRSSLRQSSTS